MTVQQRAGESPAGHVFVVSGRIELVVHDVAIVPTSQGFNVRNYWWELLGCRDEREVRRLAPPDWAGLGHARARGREDLFFVSVGGRQGLSLDELLGRVEAVVRAAAEVAHSRSGRTKPVVALPFIGIEGGGHGRQRGQVVRELLVRLAAVAVHADVDIAVVTPDAAVYSAAQHLRRRHLDLGAGRAKQAREIARKAADGSLALFLGAGVSLPAGLPTWGELLSRLAAEADLVEGALEGLAVLDQAELIEKKLTTYKRSIVKIVEVIERPALAHCLLAALGCREVVTTNYDELFERAVRASGNDTTTVMPWHRVDDASSWVLKLHGDVSREESIVLTRRHFVRFEATTKPAGALLQSLMMTRHLLLVGASLNDDNVVRLMHEVQAYREEHHLPGVLGSLLDVADDGPRRELWDGQLQWITMPGASVADRARSLEVFLDDVSCLATQDESWLLDERFNDLLDDDEQAVARRARHLLGALEGRPRFDSLARELRARGGSPGLPS